MGRAYTEVPLDVCVPQFDDLHVSTDQKMAFLLLPSGQHTTSVSDRIGLGDSAEGRSEFHIALGLVTMPYPDATLA